ncbi:MAG: M1 family metallopeptidase [Deltaproteobacteria bacterium]|nr:M1 family metallopeptidase [Deltaproteobacteria bacterium]
MKPRRVVSWVPALCLATGNALGQPTLTQTPLPPPTSDPLLLSLRPAVRAELPRAAGVSSLAVLPRYDLELVLEGQGERYRLRETVTFTNTESRSLREVVFRVYANATRPRPGTTPVRPVTFQQGRCPDAPCTVTAESPSVLVARPSAPLAPGGRLRVELEVTGVLTEIDASRTNIMAQGLESLGSLAANEGGGDYGLLSRGDGIVSLGNFYPVLARRTGARWERTDGGSVGDLGSDELSNVHATLDVPQDLLVATTGISLHTLGAAQAPVPAGRRRFEVVAGAVRDFAVVGGRALAVEGRLVGDVEVRSWFLPAHRTAGQRVLDVAAEALAVYERRFGPYPYADLDVCEAPLVGGAGGVEFPGLVTVASMFYRPATEGGGGLLGLLGGGAALSNMLPAMLEFVTAHEVAHQYWHALVGSDSRAHPFVDESLAQWSAMLYLEERYGAERARRDGDMNVRMNYQFMRTLGQDDGAVDRPTAAFATPMAYAGLVYGKGPYLYPALRAAAGDAVFFRALRRYTDTWRFRTAPPTGFTDALATEHPAGAQQYRALARRWLQEAHGDEDLGQLDLGALLGGQVPGLGPGSGVDPQQLQDMMQLLGPLLQGLQNPGAGTRPGVGGAPGAAPNGVPGADVDQIVQQILQGAGGP